MPPPEGPGPTFASPSGRRTSAAPGAFGRRFASARPAALVLVLLVVFALTGCGVSGAASKPKLTIGYIEWDENVANSTLIKVLAEDDLGYDVTLKKSDLQPVMKSVADGKTDAFLDAWMPAHRAVIKKVGGNVVVSKEPWYDGRTRFGVAVPDYMKKTKSLSDLNDSGAHMITGIEPGALLMGRIARRTIPAYHLKLALVQSSTPAMLSELNQAYRLKEPFVFLAWSPHWMNVRYRFHYLKDPKGTMNGIVNPSQLHCVYREGLKQDDPVAYALLNSMRLTEAQTNEIELDIVKVRSPEKGVRTWLKGHRQVVAPWLRAAEAARRTGRS